MTARETGQLSKQLRPSVQIYSDNNVDSNFAETTSELNPSNCNMKGKLFQGLS